MDWYFLIKQRTIVLFYFRLYGGLGIHTLSIYTIRFTPSTFYNYVCRYREIYIFNICSSVHNTNLYTYTYIPTTVSVIFIYHITEYMFPGYIAS